MTKRPKLLIRAARLGVRNYKRERDLKRLTRSQRLMSPVCAVENLMAQEDDLEQARLDKDRNYSIGRHVDILVALIGETALIARHKSATET